MTTARAQRLAEAAQAALERFAAHAESYDNAPPRRPRNGHTADCPRWLEPARWDRRCGLCWAEGNGAPAASSTVDNGARNGLIVGGKRGSMPTEPQVRAGVNERPNNIPPPVNAELRSCSTCFAPTTDLEGHCP